MKTIIEFIDIITSEWSAWGTQVAADYARASEVDRRYIRRRLIAFGVMFVGLTAAAITLSLMN